MRQPGGVAVLLPASLPVRPWPAVHRPSRGHPPFGQRPRGTEPNVAYCDRLKNVSEHRTEEEPLRS